MKKIWLRYKDNNESFFPDVIRRLAEVFRNESENNHACGVLIDTEGRHCAGGIAVRESGAQYKDGKFDISKHWSIIIENHYGLPVDGWCNCKDDKPIHCYWGFTHLNDVHKLTFAQLALVMDAYVDRKEFVEV